MKSRLAWITLCLLCTFASSTLAVVVQHVDELSTTSYDFIIIGGGTAGAVVANRLTENPKFHVLVIEAGQTNAGVLAAEVPYLSTELQGTIYDWNYTTVPQSGLNNRTLAYSRGRILGGCSSHNSMFYTRGSSDDYDRWARVTGDPGWSWARLLSYMKKNEKWSPPADGHNVRGEFEPSVHGFDGLMSVSLPGFPLPINNMILEVTKQLPGEFPYLLDMNAGRPLGLGFFQGSIGNGTRSSSVTAYLGTKFTTRRNLDILLQTEVARVLPASSKSLSFRTVQLSDAKSPRLTARKEVILSAGSINTPHILMNSGIGDQIALRKLGIDPLLHLPSVGQNLTDQPITALLFAVSSNNTLDNLQNNATLQALALEQWQKNRTGQYVTPQGGPNFIAWERLPSNSTIYQRFSDPSSGPNTPHIELAPGSGSGFFPTNGGHFAGMGQIIVSPASRGSVTLDATNPMGPPVIDVGLYTSQFDLFAMREAIRAAQRFFSAPVWNGYTVAQIAPPVNSTTDELLDEYIRTSSFHSSHGVGTAAMSATGASYGVANPDLLLKGAMGLRIVDASVMPFITAGHTQAPVYAIAERASDLIKEAWN